MLLNTNTSKLLIHAGRRRDKWTELSSLINTKAIQLKPDESFYYLNRASCYEALKKDDEAKHDYDKAKELE